MKGIGTLLGALRAQNNATEHVCICKDCSVPLRVRMGGNWQKRQEKPIPMATKRFPPSRSPAIPRGALFFLLFVCASETGRDNAEPTRASPYSHTLVL
jgi:hypothetical protein